MNKEPIKNHLDNLSELLDQDTINQLDRARRKALLTLDEPKWYQRLSWPLLGPALAAAVLVTVLLISSNHQITDSKADAFLDDLELLANDVDAELLEDLEFIAWLDQENLLEGDVL